MLKFYKNDEERFNEIKKVKKKVAKSLNISPDDKVLDVLVGYGDFSREAAKSSIANVFAIEINMEDMKEAIKRIKEEKLEDKVKIIRMDAANMGFRDETFDWVINFIGWEDLTAFSGIEGVENVFKEMVRVLKKNGNISIVFIPQIEGRDYISKFDREIEEFIWVSEKRRFFFKREFFENLFKEYNIEIIKIKTFKTHKDRMIPEDGLGKLKWTYDNYKSFYPEAEMRDFDEVIKKYGDFIKKYGMREERSNFTLIVGRK